jgi:hypothetical protein
MKVKHALLAAMTATCGLAAAHAVPALAAPAQSLISAGSASTTTDVTTVQYRGRGGFYGRGPGYGYRPYRSGYGYRPYYGYGYGLPLAAGIATTVIVAGAVRENRGRPSDFERCAAQFRSFNPRTGTYTTFAGEVRICPYLD